MRQKAEADPTNPASDDCRFPIVDFSFHMLLLSPYLFFSLVILTRFTAVYRSSTSAVLLA